MNKDMIVKAKEAKNVQELMELAKRENIEMTEEKAEELFSQLHADGELSDRELDGVSGGGCNDASVSKYIEGDIVMVEESAACYCKCCKFEILRDSGFFVDGSKTKLRFEYVIRCTECGREYIHLKEDEIICRIM